jgi:hypothetical protein
MVKMQAQMVKLETGQGRARGMDPQKKKKKKKKEEEEDSWECVKEPTT